MPDRTLDYLAKTTATLLDVQTDAATLKRCADELHDHLSSLLEFDPGETEDARFPSGRAIAPRTAAACVTDFMRTAAFMRGVDAAIEAMLQRTVGILEVVYAGTGPFATLIVPLLLHRNCSRLKLTLIDAHMRSCATVRRLMSLPGFDSVRHVIVCADAARYRHAVPIDVAIVECMQQALRNEPQVAVTLNLWPQLREGGVLVPVEIRVDVAAIAQADERGVRPGPVQHRLLSLSRSCSSSVERMLSSGETIDRQSLGGGLLALFTSIVTFGEHEVRCNESGLTVPHLLQSAEGLDAKSLHFGYVMGPEPHFVISAADDARSGALPCCGEAR